MGGVRSCRVTMAAAQRTDLTILGLLLLAAASLVSSQYLGQRIGSLSQLQHDVKGEVYAVDSRTIHIKGFSYDGAAPDAFFYGGVSGAPSDQGFIIPDENGSTKPLGRYNNKDVTLTLPDGVTLKELKWISVWCRAFTVDLGNVMVPSSLQYPRPQKINALSTLEHGVTSDRIVVVDAQTFLIPNFNYDGSAPDAHFWVGRGERPGPDGTVVPDENGATKPLKRYEGKTIVITLPDHLTVFDIDFLSVWCKAFFSDFGNVRIPNTLNVPPSLKMLGVAPQTKLNCEVLYDGLALEVRWAVAGESIVMQLVGRVADGEYMSFGLSGSDSRSVMVGGDVVTAWLERDTGRGFAQDYHLGAKAQCQGGRGSCPDVDAQGSNDVRLLNAALINNFTMLTFQRPLAATDSNDRAIRPNTSQAVIWAVGPVNSQGHTSYHTLRSRGDMLVDFGRTPRWNCPLPDDQLTAASSGDQPPQQNHQKLNNAPQAVTPSPSAWFIPPIPCYEPEDGVFYAQIGPTAGENGYNAITGHVGWGIAYYINGLLIPEINVVRGKTYTFVVEGGHDPANPSRSHPLYITDDPEGGYEFKTPAERSLVRVFAGVSQDANNSPSPSAFGRLCEWKQDPDQPASSFNSFGAYQRTLNLDCKEGQPGILQWTPDANTPDTVFYQCYTHRFLGWKIRVHDSCDASTSRSNPDYTDDFYYDDETPGLAEESSINREMSVTLDGDIPFESERTGLAAPVDDDRDVGRQGSALRLSPRSDHTSDDLTSVSTIGFDSFPFDVDRDDRPDRRHRKGNSRHPLGTKGFEFSSLPTLRKPLRTPNPASIAQFKNEAEKSSNWFGPRPDDLNFPTEGQFENPNLHMELIKTGMPFGDFDESPMYEEGQPSTHPIENPKYAITKDYNYLEVSKPGEQSTISRPGSPGRSENDDIVKNTRSDSRPNLESTASLSFNFGHVSDRHHNPNVNSKKEFKVPKNGGDDRQVVSNSRTPNEARVTHGENDEYIVEIHETHGVRDIRTPIPVKVETTRDVISQGPFARRPESNRFRHDNLFVDSPRDLRSGNDPDGFRADSIVFESDFMPIMTEDSPGPPRLLGANKEVSDPLTLREQMKLKIKPINEIRKREKNYPNEQHLGHHFTASHSTEHIRDNNLLELSGPHITTSQSGEQLLRQQKHRNGIQINSPPGLQSQGNRNEKPNEPNFSVHGLSREVGNPANSIGTGQPSGESGVGGSISGPIGFSHSINPAGFPGPGHHQRLDVKENGNLQQLEHQSDIVFDQPPTLSINGRPLFPHNHINNPTPRQPPFLQSQGPPRQLHFPQSPILNPSLIPPNSFSEGILPAQFNAGRGQQPVLPSGFHPHLVGPQFPNHGHPPSGLIMQNQIHHGQQFLNPAGQFPPGVDGIPNIGISSHFKAPSDPPHSFSVHRIPPQVAHSILRQAGPQLMPGHFHDQAGLHGGPIQHFRNKPPGGGRRTKGNPGQRRENLDHLGGLNRRNFPRNGMRTPTLNVDPMISLGSQNLPYNMTMLNSHKVLTPDGKPALLLPKDQRRIGSKESIVRPAYRGDQITGSSGNLPGSNVKPHPIRRPSGSATKSGESFLQNIWSTLTGSGSGVVSNISNRNIPPKPKPRMSR